jgi:hypothetical protein
MSELRADTITGSDGSSAVTLTKQSAAKAWLNYDQTNNTNRGSANISSVTDTSTGLYTPSFVNNFSDAYYTTVGSSNLNRRFQLNSTSYDQTTGDVDCRTTDTGTPVQDVVYNGINFHGDLA